MESALTTGRTIVKFRVFSDELDETVTASNPMQAILQALEVMNAKRKRFRLSQKIKVCRIDLDDPFLFDTEETLKKLGKLEAGK